MAWIQTQQARGFWPEIADSRELICVNWRGCQNFWGESALSLERIANWFFEETVSVVVQKSWWQGLHRCFIALSVLSLVGTALSPIALAATPKIAEASTPPVIQALRRKLDRYQPQVQILTPKAGETVQDTSIALKFAVKDLPIYKDAKLGLGPHLHVFLDEDNYQAVYDLSQPLVLKDLKPGTHTIRVFASRPWHESFKNDGAFAQVTFNVFTATKDDQPNPDLPLLTYSRPQGSYGAEPIMLDYYLTNAPLHLVADDDNTVRDWRVKATIDGTSFILDKWQPIYLKGLPTGQNWAQLEFVDAKGEAIANVFNNTVKLFDYQPGGTDSLAKLVRGELTEAEAMGMVDPNYVPPVAKPEVKPAATESKSGGIPIVPIPAPAAKPQPAKVEAKPAVKAIEPIKVPEVKVPEVKVPAKPIEAKPTPIKAAPMRLGKPPAKPEVSQPQVAPKVELKTAPKVEPKVAPKAELKPIVPEPIEVKPIAPKDETKPVEAPIAKTDSPFGGFLNRFKGNDAPAETAKPTISKPAAAAAAAGAAAAAKLIVPKLMPTPAVAPKPAAITVPVVKPATKPEVKTPEVKTPAVKAPAIKAPVAKPEVKTPAPAVVKPAIKAPAVKTPAIKTPEKPAVTIPAVKAPEKPAAKSADSPFGDVLNRFKSTAPTTPKPAAIKAPELKKPELKKPMVFDRPTVIVPARAHAVKQPEAKKPTTGPITTPAKPPIAKPAAEPAAAKPSGNFFDRFKAAPEKATTPQNTTVPTNRVPAKPVTPPKTLTQPAIKPIEIKPAVPVKPVIAPKPATIAPKAMVKAVTPPPTALKAAVPDSKPIEAKPASDKFDYLKKYLDKPATAKSIVTKPAAQPIPGKAATPQPANAIVPKSTTRRANPATPPVAAPATTTPMTDRRSETIAPDPVRASGRSANAGLKPTPQPAKAATQPAKSIAPVKTITKPNIEEKSALDNLELPKDVRNLFDRLPMPKDKPDELIPIGKLLGK